MFTDRVYSSLHLETPGDRGSAGSQGSGSPSGQPSPIGGGGQPSGGAPSASRFDPDASYDFGDGKPVKGSEYLSRFMPKDQFERGRDFLMKEAEKLEKLYGQFIRPQSQQQQQPQQPGKRPNPMDRFVDRAVIDGPALKEAYQAMAEGDIQPMHQALTQIAQVVKQQQQEIAKLRQGYGSINEQSATQDYQRKLNTSLDALGYDAATIKAHPVLRDIAEDVYLSYDPKDPNLDKEYPGLLKQRLDGLEKFIRARDKQKMDDARNIKRTFTRPGSSTQPGQPSRYVHERGGDLARRLWQESHSPNT